MSVQPSLELTSKLGIGSVQFGTAYGISNEYGQTSLEEVEKILNTAEQYQITFIDTASVYGTAETILGQNNLAAFNIVSKYMPPSAGMGSVSVQLDSSLHKLKTSSLYGYLAHRPLNILDAPEQWQELMELKRKGLIKKIGFSLYEPAEFVKLMERGFCPDLIQVPFNYFDQRFEQYLISFKKKGGEVHTRSAFLQGLFFAKTEQLPPFFDSIKPLIKSLQGSIIHLPASLLRFALEKPFIDKVIIGVNNVDHLKDNILKLGLSQELPLLNHLLPEKILIPSNWPQS